MWLLQGFQLIKNHLLYCQDFCFKRKPYVQDAFRILERIISENASDVQGTALNVPNIQSMYAKHAQMMPTSMIHNA